MSSKGTPIVTMRIPQELIDRIEERVLSNNKRQRGEPWTRASWILDAIRDKLRHQDAYKSQARGRARKVISEPGV